MAYYGIESEQMDQMGRQFESKAAEIQSLVPNSAAQSRVSAGPVPMRTGSKQTGRESTPPN